ncbi:hypothetical protein RIR_jg34446.t1 [Rhizophagus irregularis DAOM 181602=DAOM 197198]|nr:hypothetical protein RIR_jg34446.t1 [Rhizophagus irregularis DAOM 181602=DAOM 197198]
MIIFLTLFLLDKGISSQNKLDFKGVSLNMKLDFKGAGLNTNWTSRNELTFLLYFFVLAWTIRREIQLLVLQGL